MTWEAREGWPSRSSYFAARSNSRLLVNSSALSARLRQRAACSFKKELSITSPKRNSHSNFARHAVFFHQNMKHPPAQNLAYANTSDNSASPSVISETIETSRFASPISQMSVPGALFGHRSDGDEGPLLGARRTRRLSFGQASELSIPVDRELLEEIFELEVGRLSAFEDSFDKGR